MNLITTLAHATGNPIHVHNDWLLTLVVMAPVIVLGIVAVSKLLNAARL